ncbi:MAG: chemotaxis protein CheC [Gaiellales bacterium]|jgi:chemotaxis protein CheC|nr:chemotaxis protein CheC [Gaiellales bacterium]
MDLTELQLDALREMANIGSGNAATALAAMLGRPVDLNVPSAAALPLADAVDAVGDVSAEVTAVAIPVFGDIGATVLLIFEPEHAATLCGFLGVFGDPEMELSALQEIGNILGSAYINAMGSMCGVALEPAPPLAARDMLGAIVSTVLATSATSGDLALLLDSSMMVEGAECEFGFLFVPDQNGVSELLGRLGLWDEEAA